MFHRFSTWWRALVVVLLSLATVTWPSAAWGQVTPPLTLEHQSSVASLSPSGHATFSASFETAPNTSSTIIDATIFGRLTQFSQVESVLNGSASASQFSTLSSGAARFTTCSNSTTKSVVVTLEQTSLGHQPSSVPSCTTGFVTLDIHCVASACDGVYPIAYSSPASSRTIWSFISVQSSNVATPIEVSFIGEFTTNSLRQKSSSISSLRALAALKSTPLSLTANYEALVSLSSSRALSAAYKTALTNPLHQVLDAPPSNVDFSGLESSGFAAQAAQQIGLGARLATEVTGRYANTPEVISGLPSLAGLETISSLSTPRETEAVLPESDLVTPPSKTLNWGTPFAVTGVKSLTALATNQPLSTAMASHTFSDGQKSALLLGALAFLHFEAPSDTSIRSVVLESPVESLSPTFVSEFFDGLRHFPYATASPLAPLFSSNYIATSGAPASRTLASAPVSLWSSENIESLNQLVASTTSFANAITSKGLANSLDVAVARAEITGSTSERQAAIDAAQSALNNQLGKFSIDSGSITLAGSGTQLPITILSRANYSVTVVVHLITSRLSFPKGSSLVTTLNSSTKSLRIPTQNASGSDLTLQVVVTTPDGLVVLARSAIQVRIAGTSVIGYLLSFGSLVVLAAWWLRTYRRRSKGRRARV